LVARGEVPGNAGPVRAHLWMRNGVSASVSGFSLGIGPKPFTARLPIVGLGVGAALAAVLAHPRSRRRLLGISPPARTVTERSSPVAAFRRPEVLFLLIGAAFGLAFLVTTPPF